MPYTQAEIQPDIYILVDKQTNRRNEISRHADRRYKTIQHNTPTETGRLISRQTEKLADRCIGGQTNRQTETRTY